MRMRLSRRGLGVVFFTSLLVVGLFLISPLLLSRAPILEITSKRGIRQCEQEGNVDATVTTPSEEQRIADNKKHGEGVESYLCPNPGLVSNVISESTESWATFTIALDAYKKFHAEKLAQLKSGTSPTVVKTLTWACSQSKCTGLGDQLLRLQFFFILAVMSDRVFTIYWDEGLKRSSKYLLPNDIDWSFFDESIGMCTDEKKVSLTHNCAKTTFDSTSVWGFTWNKKEYAKFGDALFGPEQHITVSGWVKVYTQYIGNESILDPGDKIRAGFERLGLTDILAIDQQNTVHCGHRHFWYNLLRKLGAHRVMEIPEGSSGRIIASEPWLQVSHVIFCHLFKFPQVLVNEVDRIMSSLGLQNQKYLAVHLRTGFYGMPYQESAATRFLHRNWKMFDVPSVWDPLMERSFDLANQRIGPDSPVYLSTDTDMAKRRFRPKYGNRLRLVNSSATHSAFVRNKCEGHSSQNEEEQFSPSDPYMSMWIDFFLLGRAHVMVHSESSFSVSACFIEPVAHLNQVWYMTDHDKDCIGWYVGSNSTCLI